MQNSSGTLLGSIEMRYVRIRSVFSPSRLTALANVFSSACST